MGVCKRLKLKDYIIILLIMVNCSKIQSLSNKIDEVSITADWSESTAATNSRKIRSLNYRVGDTESGLSKLNEATVNSIDRVYESIQRLTKNLTDLILKSLNPERKQL